VSAAVVVEDLAFTYPGEHHPVFDGLDITIEAGEAWSTIDAGAPAEPTGVLVRRLTRTWSHAYHERLGLDPPPASPVAKSA